MGSDFSRYGKCFQSLWDIPSVVMGSTLSPGANISQCRIMNESGKKCHLKYNYGRNSCLLLVVFVILTPKLN